MDVQHASPLPVDQHLPIRKALNSRKLLKPEGPQGLLRGARGCSQVDILGLRYKSVTLGAARSPGLRIRLAQEVN